MHEAMKRLSKIYIIKLNQDSSVWFNETSVLTYHKSQL